jgi:hypothetical protein
MNNNRISRLFAIVSCDTQRRILFEADGTANLNDLSKVTGHAKQYVCRFMRLLLAQGLIGKRKSGRCVYYMVIDEDLKTLLFLATQMERRLNCAAT